MPRATSPMFQLSGWKWRAMRFGRHANSTWKWPSLSDRDGVLANPGFHAGQRSKVLAPAWVDVTGPGHFDNEPPRYVIPEAQRIINAEPGPDEDQIVALVAAKRRADGLDGRSCIDLTPFLEDGRLRWPIPDGEWRIMAFRIKYTGQQNQAQNEKQTPWVVDHMSRKAVEAYCDRLGAIFAQALGGEFGCTIDTFFCDSFEILPLPNTLLWSNGTLAGFQRHKGYSLTPFLPAIWWDIGDARRESATT